MQEKEEQTEEQTRIKDRECVNCVLLFECKGKPRHIKQCLYFKERRHDKQR